jgi:hypothetical protein
MSDYRQIEDDQNENINNERTLAELARRMRDMIVKMLLVSTSGKGRTI